MPTVQEFTPNLTKTSLGKLKTQSATTKLSVLTPLISYSVSRLLNIQVATLVVQTTI